MSDDNAKRCLRVLLADDHRLVRSALSYLVESFPGVSVVGEVGSQDELLELVASESPDIALVDASILTPSSPDAMRRLCRLCEGTSVVAMSRYASDAYIRHMLAAGACGFLHKDSAVTDLESAIRKAEAGECFVFPGLEPDHLVDLNAAPRDQPLEWNPLTARQREVLRLVALGHRSKAIAEKLGVTVKTVETHRAEIMHRLGVRHVAGMVREAIQMGLISSTERWSGKTEDR